MPIKKTILFINGNLSVGGTERSLINIINAIDKDKYSVDLLLYQPGRELLPYLTTEVRVISKDTTESYGPIINATLGNLLKGKWFEFAIRIANTLPSELGRLVLKALRRSFGLRKRYDFVIAFRPEFAEDIALNCVKATKKFTWWHHGDFSNGVCIRQLRHNWKKFDRIVTVSKGIADYLQSNIPEAVDKMDVIYNMINIDEIKAKSATDCPFESNGSELKLVTVSRLSPEKNLKLIIDIANELLARDIEFKWVILGNGPEYNNLKHLISDNNLSDYIDLHGETKNPYVWMQHADLMIHPSLVESFGLVLIESMAVGTPCIAGKSIGAKDLITAENGVLVDNNPAEYADAIVRYFHDKNKLHYSSTCPKSIDRYTSRNVISTFYELISN